MNARTPAGRFVIHGGVGPVAGGGGVTPGRSWSRTNAAMNSSGVSASSFSNSREIARSALRSQAINAVEGEVQAVDRCEVALDFSEPAG
jgi:hypothetical protein